MGDEQVGQAIRFAGHEADFAHGKSHGSPRVRRSGKGRKIGEEDGSFVLEFATHVTVEFVGGDVVVDIEIEPAVPVQVAENGGKATAVKVGNTCLFSDFLEGTIAAVTVETVRLGVERIGIKGEGHHVGAKARNIAWLEAFGIKVDIVADVEIQVSVAVVVAPCHTGSPQGVVDSGLVGDFFKDARAAVAEKAVGPVVANVKILVAIAVVVSETCAHAESVWIRYARLVCNVCELPVVVSVEAVGVGFDVPCNSGEIDDVEVPIAVAVNVAPSQAAGVIFRQHSRALSRSMAEVDTPFTGLVRKANECGFRYVGGFEIGGQALGGVGEVGVLEIVEE